MDHYTWGLTNTELEIMEIFWKQDAGISFKDLMDCLNNEFDKQWKRQTLSTYLSNLQKLGLIKSNGQHKNYIYYATCSRDEFIHKQTKKLVKNSYNNSLTQFLVAFTGGQTLSKKEADSLYEFLNEPNPEDK